MYVTSFKDNNFAYLADMQQRSKFKKVFSFL